MLLTVRSVCAVPGSGVDRPQTRQAAASTIALDGVWTRTAVAGGPELPPAVAGRLPLGWGKTEEFPESAFCGTMRYETTCDVRQPTSDRVLDLGRVEQSAKVFVNGRYAGAAIMPPYRVKIARELLKEGVNTLSVEVTSTGANRLRWLDREKPYAWKTFTDINMVDINYKKFDAAGWSVREYGLFGPVVLR